MARNGAGSHLSSSRIFASQPNVVRIPGPIQNDPQRESWSEEGPVPSTCMARRFVLLGFTMLVSCSGPTEGLISTDAAGGQRNGGGVQGEEPGADDARAEDLSQATDDAGARPDAPASTVAHPPGASGCGFAAAAFC